MTKLTAVLTSAAILAEAGLQAQLAGDLEAALRMGDRAEEMRALAYHLQQQPVLAA